MTQRRVLKCGNQTQKRTQVRGDLVPQRQTRTWTFKQVRVRLAAENSDIIDDDTEWPNIYRISRAYVPRGWRFRYRRRWFSVAKQFPDICCLRPTSWEILLEFTTKFWLQIRRRHVNELDVNSLIWGMFCNVRCSNSSWKGLFGEFAFHQNLWDLVIEVFHSSSNQTNKTKNQVQGNLSRDTTSNKHTQNITKVPTQHDNFDLNNVDCLPSNAKFSRFGVMLYIFEDKKPWFKMIIKGRSPTMWHASSELWILICMCMDIKLAGTKQNLDPMWKILMKDVDLGELTSVVDNVYFGCIFWLYSTAVRNKQRYCRQLQEHVHCPQMSVFGTHWWTRHSMVSTQTCTSGHKMDQSLWQTLGSFDFLYTMLGKSAYFFVVLWYGRSCQEICGTILWVS